jgi:hypothetical protein
VCVCVCVCVKPTRVAGIDSTIDLDGQQTSGAVHVSVLLRFQARHNASRDAEVISACGITEHVYGILQLWEITKLQCYHSLPEGVVVYLQQRQITFVSYCYHLWMHAGVYM